MVGNNPQMTQITHLCLRHLCTGGWPVILLDEVMAELDLQRRADLLNYVSDAEQVLFTATDANMFTPEFIEKAEVWTVHDGSIQRGS